MNNLSTGICLLLPELGFETGPSQLYSIFFFFFFSKSFLTLDIPGVEEAGSMHNSFLNCQLLATCLTCVT